MFRRWLRALRKQTSDLDQGGLRAAKILRFADLR